MLPLTFPFATSACLGLPLGLSKRSVTWYSGLLPTRTVEKRQLKATHETVPKYPNAVTNTSCLQSSDKLWYVNNARCKFVVLNTTDVMTRLLNVDRKTPVRSGRQRKTGAERTSQWTSSSTWESPASYPVTSRVFAAKRETPLTRETRTLRCGPHSRVSVDNIEGHHEQPNVCVS